MHIATLDETAPEALQPRLHMFADGQRSWLKLSDRLPRYVDNRIPDPSRRPPSPSSGRADEDAIEPVTRLRVARPTDDLDALLPFYERGLGLTILHRFENYDGFDGVMLGRPGVPHHFEFTRARGHHAGRAPSPDNLLVFYLPNPAEWQAAVERMTSAGFQTLAAFNPYWDQRGATFEAPDGYRIVLQRSAWLR